jgi:ribosomal protein L37AE/L43A
MAKKKRETQEYGTCMDCGKNLHVSEMPKQFRIWICKDCRAERNRVSARKWRAKHRKKREVPDYGPCVDCGKILHVSEMSKYFRIWLCEDCRAERKRASGRRWYAEHREQEQARTRKRDRKLRAENPELYNAIHGYFAVRWAQKKKAENPEAFLEARRQYMREYYRENKEKFREYQKQFKEKNPGYHKKYYQEKIKGRPKPPDDSETD